MKQTTSKIDKIALEKVARSNVYSHDNEGDSLRVQQNTEANMDSYNKGNTMIDTDATESKHTRQRWTVEERAIIARTLTDGVDLETIKTLIPLHDEVSILREVHRRNEYGIRTMNGGIKKFFPDIKTRNRVKKEELVAVKSVEATTTANLGVDNNQQNSIVPIKAKNTSKELRLLALDLLFREDLMIIDQSVKQAARLLSQFRKEIS